MDQTVVDRVAASQTQNRRFSRMQELGLIIVVAVMWIVLTIVGHERASAGQQNLFLNPHFLLENLATPMSYYAIMAVGMTMVIISGGIDISVGSTMGLAAFWSAAILQMIPRHASAWEVIPVALLVGPLIGLCCGIINGLLTVGLGVHPFIITLGTLSIFRCATLVTPHWMNWPATLPTPDKYLPQAFTDHFMRWGLFSQRPDALRPVPLMIMLAVTIVGWIFLQKTIGGREIYAVGGNEEAARFSGLRVNLIKVRVYALAGLAAGIAGTVSLGQYGATSTSTGTTYELDVIAAAVVGGASLLGGRGTALGALLGTLILFTIQAGVYIMNWPEEYRTGIAGSAIIVAVAIDRFSETFRLRRLGARAH